MSELQECSARADSFLMTWEEVVRAVVKLAQNLEASSEDHMNDASETALRPMSRCVPGGPPTETGEVKWRRN